MKSLKNPENYQTAQEVAQSLRDLAVDFENSDTDLMYQVQVQIWTTSEERVKTSLEKKSKRNKS